jgi:hypothetical protein
VAGLLGGVMGSNYPHYTLAPNQRKKPRLKTCGCNFSVNAW